ncbi:MAG: dihydrolipoyl dehydrogenase [Candidatus Marinimicrobia bacterium]|nr:dihydrolipoyl dehydrogenase [Candidatus Neomarinimicrobiota bacterium]
MDKFDVIVIGGGPGGYVAAIRAAQLGKRVAVVEKEHLGGICLNWGCIPTKSLLKNSEVLTYIKNASKYGIDIKDYSINWKKVIKRSRDVSRRLNKGIEYLLKKNKIDYIQGTAKVLDNNKVEVNFNNKKTVYEYLDVIVATGARPNYFPGMEPNGKNIITYKEAMTLEEQPKSLAIIGAGAIGIEFADFYNNFGTEVTVIEALPNILPIEDEEVSLELKSIFEKRKINIKTNTMVEKIESLKTKVKVHLNDGNIIEADKALVAIGVKGNTEGLGLDKLGVDISNNVINVNQYMQTNIDNIYAIGDVAGPPWLAHVASAEGMVAAEYLSKYKTSGMEYDNIPGCTYCHPEVASIGLTEKEAKEKGYKIKIGKFPFRALGKAMATGDTEGFVKVVFDSKYGELLGCHIIGPGATDLIIEAGIARKLETTWDEILLTVHPHPTLSEAFLEATADALKEAIHI